MRSRSSNYLRTCRRECILSVAEVVPTCIVCVAVSIYLRSTRTQSVSYVCSYCTIFRSFTGLVVADTSPIVRSMAIPNSQAMPYVYTKDTTGHNKRLSCRMATISPEIYFCNGEAGEKLGVVRACLPLCTF